MGYPTEGEVRVRRGGSWNNISFCCRGADRDYNTPGVVGDYLGFGAALPAGQ